MCVIGQAWDINKKCLFLELNLISGTSSKKAQIYVPGFPLKESQSPLCMKNYKGTKEATNSLGVHHIFQNFVLITVNPHLPTSSS